MNPIPSNNSQTSSIDLTRPVEPCSPLVADILNIIFSQSDIKSLGNISSVSREWHVESGKDEIWQAHKGEFKVEGPNIKAKIKASIPTIEELFNEILKDIDAKIFDPEGKAFISNLVKVLFEKENIRSIKLKSLPSCYRNIKWFTLNLKEEKQINFNNSDIFNIIVPKKVMFAADEYGLDFVKEVPIQINNKRLSMGVNKCVGIYLDFDKILVANCLYESRFLLGSFKAFKTDKTLLDSIKKY